MIFMDRLKGTHYLVQKVLISINKAAIHRSSMKAEKSLLKTFKISPRYLPMISIGLEEERAETTFSKTLGSKIHCWRSLSFANTTTWHIDQVC